MAYVNAADFVVAAPTPRGRATIAGCHSAGAAPPVEVSAAASGSPLMVSKAAGGALVLAFEQVADATAYNVYAGTIGSWYSHGTSPGTDCDAATVPAMPGRLSTVMPVHAGSSYLLVSASNATGEGETGSRGDGRAIPLAEATCAP